MSPVPVLVKFGLLPEKHTAFFLCDIQEKFRPAMLHFQEIVQAADKLVQTSKILGIPLIVTEQNPAGLGSTVKELDVNHAVGVHNKTKFSMIIPKVETQINDLCGGQLQCVVLFGLETHICVEQTAAELCARGYKVHIAADACTSRTQEDRILAFERLRQMGCFITTAETVIFKLLGDKEHPKFSAIRPLFKSTTNYTGLAFTANSVKTLSNS
ncbi:Isochorismatase domain-containing protein 1 [Frankliniella fusca]|uniref:Isochorismatase domain-containing protein 1 n=1 Tax=Frankliniella fusca TaxID=407009 RepID=A0AAE1HYW9_9NEOP|nr:Isochorismatase domain-containing protein 1 [Frankliniella fusca]